MNLSYCVNEASASPPSFTSCDFPGLKESFPMLCKMLMRDIDNKLDKFMFVGIATFTVLRSVLPPSSDGYAYIKLQALVPRVTTLIAEASTC